MGDEPKPDAAKAKATEKALETFAGTWEIVAVQPEGITKEARKLVFRKDGTFVSEYFFDKQTRLTGSVYEIAFSPDADQRFIYMVDGANGEVRIVDRKSMQVLGRFGRVGRQAGEFVAVHNITVDKAGNIYTAEVNTGQRVQKFRRIDMQD